MKDLTQGNIYKNFFLFSIPIVLSTILSSAFSIINTSIAGLFLGAEGLATTSVTSSYIIIMSYLITGQSYGLSVYAANLFGAKDYDRLKRVFYSNAFLVFCALVCFTGISICFSTPILRFLNVDEHIFDDAARYFVFHCIAFTISGVNTMFMTCCHSMGETKFPLIVSFLLALLSVLGNLLTVAVLDLGVIGLGISSIFANFVVFCLYWFRLRGYFRQLGVGTKIPKPSWREVKPLFAYSLPNIFQQCSMGAAAFLIAPLRNGLGYLIVAAYSISSNIHSYITQLYYSASKTASNYIAQCVGAKKYHKIKKPYLPHFYKATFSSSSSSSPYVSSQNSSADSLSTRLPIPKSSNMYRSTFAFIFPFFLCTYSAVFSIRSCAASSRTLTSLLLRLAVP
ncbi:MAG: hypothetical protein IJD64_06205 [Clostridia bacterium]|nr:hypothetical protein [Clostridia bacterium]